MYRERSVLTRTRSHLHGLELLAAPNLRVSTDRPPNPARLRAQLARLDAEIKAARRRRELLEFERDIAPHTSGYREPEDLDVALAKVDATIAELEADLEELAVAGAPVQSPPVAVPSGSPANDTASASAASESEYVDTREAASMLGISPRTLEGLRARGLGPAHVRIGRAVRYRRDDLRRPAK